MKKQKVTSQINLERLAGGAFAEKLNEALMQVAENIQNPNTEATTKRQINIAIKFAPNKSRQVINTQISVTTKLAATEAIDTQMVMGVNIRTGQIEIAEYDGQIRGQMNLSDFAEEEPQKEEAAGQQEAEPAEAELWSCSPKSTGSSARLERQTGSSAAGSWKRQEAPEGRRANKWTIKQRQSRKHTLTACRYSAPMTK